MSENKVKWHPYPEEKPKNDSRNPYLVTWLYDGVCGKEPEAAQEAMQRSALLPHLKTLTGMTSKIKWHPLSLNK